MLEGYRLPNQLRRDLEKELEPTETIRWIERPMLRVFTPPLIGTCIALFISLAFFSFVALTLDAQARDFGRSLMDFMGITGILVNVMGIGVPLFLLIFLPIAVWDELRRTVYVMTQKRAFILIAGRTRTIHSFAPAELRALTRREHADGSGDVIVYTHKTKDYDGDEHTQELGFKHVRDAKAFEKMLRQIASN